MANKVLVLCVLALVFVQACFGQVNITYTSNVQSQYSIGTSSSVPFSFTIISLPDYLGVSVNISACLPIAWSLGYMQWCLPSSCVVVLNSQPASPLTINCAVQIPSSWKFAGPVEARLQYFVASISSTTPYWAQSLANFTIVYNSPAPCPLGQAPVNGVCTNCSIGTYGGDGRMCTPCPLGSSGVSAGLTNCTPCAPGFYGGGGTSHCIISPAGYYAPGGTYRSTACDPGSASQTGQSSCQQCTPPTYNPSSGSQYCNLCPAGKIATAYGSSSCFPCPPGTYAPQAAPACIYCPINHYSTTLGASSSSSCIACPSGTKQIPGCFHAASCCV